MTTRDRGDHYGPIELAQLWQYNNELRIFSDGKLLHSEDIRLRYTCHQNKTVKHCMNTYTNSLSDLQ